MATSPGRLSQAGYGHLRARRAILCAPSPESWQEFRRRLVSGGIKVVGETGENNTAVIGVGDSSGRVERQPVAPANEQLLKSQNAALWKEYLEGAWAHESPCPEAGSLVCRMPLQMQLTRQMRAGTGKTVWPDKLREKLSSELPSGGDSESATEEDHLRLFEQWSSNTMYMMRLAEGLIGDCLRSISSQAEGGVVSVGSIPPDQRELLSLYSDAQDSWQEVALVLRTAPDGAGAASEGSGDGGSVAAECVVINRPIARSMSAELAELLLNGAEEARFGAARYDAQFVGRFLRAFGDEAAVYVGGPDAQDEPGLCVHGLDLPGAEELAPGTRIFLGGVEAVVDAVLQGTMRPLDVRWFVGRRRGVSTQDSAYSPVACSRPLALKQCLGLPKPLWHEVLETAGGELAEISRVELLKRSDLRED